MIKLVKTILIIILFLFAVGLAHESNDNHGHDEPSLQDNNTDSAEDQSLKTGKRFLYSGYVDMERMALNEIKQRLIDTGCRGDFNDNGCHFVEVFLDNGEPNSTGNATSINDETSEQKGEAAIIVHITGASFGSDSIALTETTLYAIKDMEGPLDYDKFKEAVNGDIATLGSFVSLKEDSWTITATDSSDIVYATGSDASSQMLQFMKSRDTTTVGNSIYTPFIVGLIILGIFIVGIAGYAGFSRYTQKP